MSHKIRLSLEETYLLADKMAQTRNKKLSRRLLAVSLRHFGYKVREISPIVGASERTVSKWLGLYLEGGFDALLAQHYPPDKGSVLQPHQEAIREFWKARPEATLLELQQWLAGERGVEVEYSWLFRYVERHGLGKEDS